MQKLIGSAIQFTNIVNLEAKHQPAENHEDLVKVTVILILPEALGEHPGSGEILFNYVENVNFEIRYIYILKIHSTK